MIFSDPYFCRDDALQLFHNKMIVLIGDSVMRAAYKDLVKMLVKGSKLEMFEMKRRGEISFLGDRRIEGGNMHNGKDYKEVRQYQSPTHLVRFYFVTRAYNSYVRTVLADFVHEPRPDIILMGSCVWDITRYGPSGIHFYRENLHDLFTALRRVLKPEALMIWATALPVGAHVTGGVLLKNIDFMEDILRLDVLMANFLASKAVKEFGYDMLDLHSVFRRRVWMRLHDGIHWNEFAHRLFTYWFMDHVQRAWHITLPIHEFFSNLANTRRTAENSRM